MNQYYLVSNVTVEELNGGADVKLAISTLWALDPTNVSGQTANGPIPATTDMEAGTAAAPCNSTQDPIDDGPNGNAEKIAGFAFDGYKMMKYGNQNPYPFFASNTYSKASTFNQNNTKQYLSPDKLFGQDHSVIPQYNTLYPASTCLTTSEIDTYSQEMYATFFDIAGTDKRVIDVGIYFSENGYDIGWRYGNATKITEWLQVYTDPTFDPVN